MLKKQALHQGITSGFEPNFGSAHLSATYLKDVLNGVSQNEVPFWEKRVLLHGFYVASCPLGPSWRLSGLGWLLAGSWAVLSGLGWLLGGSWAVLRGVGWLLAGPGLVPGWARRRRTSECSGACPVRFFLEGSFSD